MFTTLEKIHASHSGNFGEEDNSLAGAMESENKAQERIWAGEITNIFRMQANAKYSSIFQEASSRRFFISSPGVFALFVIFMKKSKTSSQSSFLYTLEMHYVLGGAWIHRGEGKPAVLSTFCYILVFISLSFFAETFPMLVCLQSKLWLMIKMHSCFLHQGKKKG